MAFDCVTCYAVRVNIEIISFLTRDSQLLIFPRLQYCTVQTVSPNEQT